MKKLLLRVSSLLMIISILLSLVVIPASAATTPTGYTSASDVNYVKDGKYVANWGVREEDCLFLSTYAQSFYSGSSAFDSVSLLAGGTTEAAARTSAIYYKLQDIMESAQTYVTSYDATKALYKYTDCEKSGYTVGISSFYSGTKIGPNWGNGWNREHTWPNSKGSGSSENDIMMLRPTSTSENSSRGNKAYGESSGYYNPNSESGGKYDLRGDVSRIVLFVYVRWGLTNTGSGYNPNGICGTAGIIESIDLLLEWMEADPVDTWEMGRNDAVQSITGTRNVFVDYPEYAWLLFGRSVPTDMPTPSGEANGGTITPGTQGGSGSGGDNTGSGDSGNTGTGGTTTGITGDELTAPLEDGDVVVIANPFYNKLLSMTKVTSESYYNKGVDYTGGDFSVATDDEKFTVKLNSDGSYTFTSLSGKVLAMADSYTSLNDTGANNKWTLEAVSGKTGVYYVKNTVRGNYLEWYSDNNNWSAYTNNNNDCYEIAFYAAEGAQGGGNTSGGGSTGEDTGDTPGGSTGGNTGSGDNTGSGTGGSTGGTSCKDGGTSHNWSDWIVTEEPTLAKDGQAIRTCPDCQTLETKAVKYECTHQTTELRGAKSATCGEEGYTGNTHCADCGELLSYGSKLDKSTEHSYGEWVTTKEPTSVALGECERSCSVCEKKQYDILPTVEADNTPVIVGASVGGVSVIGIALFFILRKRII